VNNGQVGYLSKRSSENETQLLTGK